jgi:hypothetical protein
MKRGRVAFVGIVLGMALSAPIVAWASHGKPGLWEIKVQTDMDPMQGMPDMSKMPPEVRARIEAMHKNGMTARHCMTAAEVASDKPNLSHNASCKATNVRASGQTFSADLVCSGKMSGTGHVRTTFASPDHYTSVVTMTGTASGHPVNNAMKIDAHWISPNCGKVH